MKTYKSVAAQKKREGDRYLKSYLSAYHDDVRRWSLEPDDQSFLNEITIGPITDRALWSNRRVRRAAQHALIDAALDEYARDRKRKRYWVTLTWDLGLSWERCPQFDLIAIRNTAQHHLRRIDLDGVGSVEIDSWKNLTGEAGRRMVAHVHFIGWPAGSIRFRRKAAQSKLRKSRALKNSIGAPSAVIKDVGPNAKDIAHLAMYMLKAPSTAKNPVRRGEHFRFWSTALSAGSAARLVEVFSHLEAGDVLFGIGTGTKLSRAVQARISRVIRPGARRLPAPSRDQTSRHWRRIRLTNGSRDFREPKIVTRMAQRRDDDG